MSDILYECKECNLFYKDPNLAEKCEVWCRENGTCNVEITKYAVGNYGTVSCGTLDLHLPNSE